MALDRLARHQAMLERLILDADEQTGREMDDAGFAGITAGKP
ncbi:MAG TPA: hypothetical protein VJ001_15215 [Rhodocyclaceae bacterium]|nr:hypothetical protein [Rhodocyclaceae bacterium]